MENVLKFTLEYLAKIHQKKEDEIFALLFDGDMTAPVIKDDALTTLISLEGERVTKLKSTKADITQAVKSQTGRIYKELKEQIENAIPDFTSDKEIGDEFFAELSEAVKKTPQPTPGTEITDDVLKTSKPYIHLTVQHGREIARLNDEHAKAIEKIKSDQDKEKTLGYVKAVGLKQFKGMNPILPDNASVADRVTEKLFLNELVNGYDYDVQGEGEQTIITPLKDGKPLQDNLGHAIDFNSHVKHLASLGFTFAASDPKAAAGNPLNLNQNGDGKNGQGKSKKFQSYSLKKPANDAEWMQRHGEIENDKELSASERIELQVTLKNLHEPAPAPAPAS